MVTRTAPISRESQMMTVAQSNLATYLLTFAWPAAWCTLLIYGLVRLIVSPGEVVPAWLFLLLIVLGAG